MSSGARQELAVSWPVLIGAFIGVAAGISALPYYTQGVFVPPLTHEFNWSREQLSFIVLAGGIVLAIVSPFVGVLVDRFGVRVPLTCSFAAMILGFIGLSRLYGVLYGAFTFGLGLSPVLISRMQLKVDHPYFHNYQERHCL